MVARAGGYFRRLFKEYQCMTQGDPLYPTIFNMVVYAVIRHWVKVVTPTEAGTGGLGLTIIDLVAYFYDNNVLVALTQPERLQRDFDVLTNLFDQFGLQKNTGKMVGTVCQTYHELGRMSEDAYKRLTTRIGPTFWEHQRRRVEFPDCGSEAAAGLLMMHHQIQHGVVRGYPIPQPHPPGSPILTRSPS